ncbi:MAG: hypothetical protein KDD41_13300 [Flavobacteriales bacterium]|nr:hypothetical protein [Flavobacteriales bacterium]
MLHNFIKSTLLLLALAGSFILSAQNIPIGTWQDHLPYNDAVSVTEGDGIIYCATNSGVFTYDLNDFSLNKLNLVNGLSDIGVSKIRFNPYNNRVVVAYKNGNIDIIDEEKNIINLSFIKNSNVIGDKSIYDIYILGKLAYLSTGFGIVVLDTDKLEIQDTYLIGNLGGYVKVNAVTFDSLNIYAATDQGVYYADKTAPNLVDYNVWSTVSQLGAQAYSEIVYFQKKLLVVYDRISQPDSIYIGDSGNWQPFIPQEGNVNNLCMMNESSLAIVWDYGIYYYDQNFNQYGDVYRENSWEIIRGKNFHYWIANGVSGLIHMIDPWNPDLDFIHPNGPSSSKIFEMDLVDEELWFVAGGYNISNNNPSFLSEFLVNYKTAGSWNTMGRTVPNATGGNLTDAVCVAINPNNTSEVYFGAWDAGMFKVNNGVVSTIYTAQNSKLDSTFFGTTKIGGLEYDNDGNLWITNAFTNKPLHVITPENDWYSYSLAGISSSDAYPKIIIDANNYKWMISPKSNKIAVFDDNGTLSDLTDDRITINTNFPGAKIFCIVEDRDGEIWVGTDEGVAVFFNPSDVFDKTIEAEPIYIQQEGQTQILLETESVNAIAIDGANRKWIGTQSSGVYLMSADGTEQVEHFTTENSPLFSNTIYDIGINHKTGDIYFGTDKGLISYKGTATEPQSDFDVFVYPNPVKPDYEGVIAIRGLVKDTDVRITDISGNIVFETTSLGGQAIWDGKDFHGNRVQSGVYMVFNGSPEGTLKAAAKILFLN